MLPGFKALLIKENKWEFNTERQNIVNKLETVDWPFRFFPNFFLSFFLSLLHSSFFLSLFTSFFLSLLQSFFFSFFFSFFLSLVFIQTVVRKIYYSQLKTHIHTHSIIERERKKRLLFVLGRYKWHKLIWFWYSIGQEKNRPKAKISFNEMAFSRAYSS